MRVHIYKVEKENSGVLIKTDETIEVKKRHWVDKNNHSHPMKFSRPIAFENNNVYFLHLFGDDSKLPHCGKHISLNFWQNQKFKLMQNIHWLQKEDNVRYLINVLFLIAGITIGVLNYLK